MLKPCILIAALLVLFIALPTYSQPVPDEAVPDEPAVEGEQGPCQVMPTLGGIHCVREDGQSRWEIHHPSLWENVEAYQEQLEDPLPVVTAVVAGRTFYAVRNDLLEVDTEAGVVISRRRMPARILSLNPAEGHDKSLAIILRHKPSSASAEVIDISLTYGLDAPLPSQNVWLGDTIAGRLAARHDAEWLISNYDEEEHELVFKALAHAYERDPLNLFYLAYLTKAPHQARFLGDLGEDEGDEALLRIWKEAIRPSNPTGLTGPPWQDMILVSWWLQEDLSGRTSAQEVFRSGYQKMIDAGILPERITSYVTLILLHMEGRKVIEEAVAAQDVALVEELSERLAISAPLADGGEYAWVALARWLEERDHPGQHWHERARLNEERSFSSSGADARAVGRYFAILIGITLALFIYPFVVGVQGGRLRRRGSDEDSETSLSFWDPVLKVRDILGLVALLLALHIVAFLLAVQLIILGAMASAPLSVFDDTLAAPDVETWLEELAKSPPRDELLAIARSERKALEEGRLVLEKSPVNRLLRDAIAADARATQWKELRQWKMFAPFPGGYIDPLSRSISLSNFLLRSFLFTLGLLAVLILMGSLLGNRAPGVGLWIVRIVPGTAPALAPIGGLILAACLASLGALMGFDKILSILADPTFVPYFGLRDLDESDLLVPSKQWAFIALGGAVILQAIGVYLSTRSRSS